jgi:Fe-S cluster assembly ATP-binding protein
MNRILEVKDLHASVEGVTILKGVDLIINAGEIHAIMGPNGSGKSTLSNVLMGHPSYKVESGDILFKGESILNWTTDERARKGMFLSFQYPTALPGITIPNFFRTVLKSIRGEDIPMREFKKELKDGMKELEMPEEFLKRYVNDGFSGGEKKRTEILQMSLIKPALAILDETDSGLDIDALRIVSQGITNAKSPERSILLITHYQRMLNYVVPDFIHVFAKGRIIQTGDKDLALELEKSGYDGILEKAGLNV